MAAHHQLYVGGVARRLLSVRDSGKMAVARFEGISDRSAAEALRGSLVEVDRAQLPPLEEGEYYHADLIGLPAVDGHGSAVGTVTAVENYGAGGAARNRAAGRQAVADPVQGRHRGCGGRPNRPRSRVPGLAAAFRFLHFLY